MDGKYVYCFSNEHWSANTKEVSFNVHGIVYVPESEAPQDPLEKEGLFGALYRQMDLILTSSQSVLCLNWSIKLETNRPTLLYEKGHIETRQRAPTEE